jgi:hypothetical protein
MKTKWSCHRGRRELRLLKRKSTSRLVSCDWKLFEEGAFGVEDRTVDMGIVP